MASAAAQETRIIWFSSQSFLICMVSPLVDGPMMASTLSSSINCLANETVFSGLPPLSLMINSSFRPSTPPEALILSTSIFAVLASGAPRKDAGPVTEKMAPILMGWVSAAAKPRGAASRAASQQAPTTNGRIFFIGGFGSMPVIAGLERENHLGAQEGHQVLVCVVITRPDEFAPEMSAYVVVEF